MNKLLSLAVTTAALSLATSASAEGLHVAGDAPATKIAAPASAPVGAEIGFYFFDSKMTLDSTFHAVGGSLPDPLDHRNLRLLGTGSTPGGELRITVLPRLDPVGRTRIGFGFGVMGLTRMTVASDALQPSVSFTPGDVWGVRLDGFIGHEFPIGRRADVLAPGRRAWLYPYVDIRAAGAIVQTKLDLHVGKFGDVGATTVNAYDFSVGPRAGVAIPLTPHVALDVGGFKSVYGGERYGGYAGLAVTIP